jgi:hypothetical protein
VSVSQFRCSVGDQIIDRYLLELGQRGQREFTTYFSPMEEGVSTDLVTHNGRNEEAVQPQGRFKERCPIRSSQKLDPTRTV